MPPAAVLTSSIAYFRMHGRGGNGWIREFDGEPPAGRGNNYLYSPAELEEWKARIDRVAPHAAKTFITFTNDAGGRAVVNALQLRALIDGRQSRAPASLIARFPSQLSGFGPDRAVQEMLFVDSERAVA